VIEHPDHYYDRGSYRAIQFIIVSEVIDVIGKSPGDENGKKCCQPRTGTEELPFLRIRRCISVYYTNGKKVNNHQNKPAGSGNNIDPDPVQAKMKPFFD